MSSSPPTECLLPLLASRITLTPFADSDPFSAPGLSLSFSTSVQRRWYLERQSYPQLCGDFATIRVE